MIYYLNGNGNNILYKVKIYFSPPSLCILRTPLPLECPNTIEVTVIKRLWLQIKQLPNSFKYINRVKMCTVKAKNEKRKKNISNNFYFLIPAPTRQKNSYDFLILIFFF